MIMMGMAATWPRTITGTSHIIGPCRSSVVNALKPRSMEQRLWCSTASHSPSHMGSLPPTDQASTWPPSKKTGTAILDSSSWFTKPITWHCDKVLISLPQLNVVAPHLGSTCSRFPFSFPMSLRYVVCCHATAIHLSSSWTLAAAILNCMHCHKSRIMNGMKWNG